MTATAVAVVLAGYLLVALALTGVAAWAWRSSSAGSAGSAEFDGRLRRRVIVTLKSEDAFSGLLFASDRECLVLRDAEALAYGEKKTNLPVEGELLVLRADVAYIQIVPSGAP